MLDIFHLYIKPLLLFDFFPSCIHCCKIGLRTLFGYLISSDPASVVQSPPQCPIQDRSQLLGKVPVGSPPVIGCDRVIRGAVLIVP